MGGGGTSTFLLKTDSRRVFVPERASLKGVQSLLWPMWGSQACEAPCRPRGEDLLSCQNK